MAPLAAFNCDVTVPLVAADCDVTDASAARALVAMLLMGVTTRLVLGLARSEKIDKRVMMEERKGLTSNEDVHVLVHCYRVQSKTEELEKHFELEYIFMMVQQHYQITTYLSG